MSSVTTDVTEHTPPTTESVEATGIATELQKRLDAQAEETAKLKMDLQNAQSKIAKVDDQVRSELKEHQPMVVDYIKSEMGENPSKKHFGDVLKWAEGIHTSKVPEMERPLTELLVCASAKHKRSLDASNAHSEVEGALKAKCSDFDKLQSEFDVMKKKCGELEELCMSSQTAKEALIRKTVESTHNFSHKENREVAGSSGTGSGSVNPMARDELTSWISSNGTASLKAWQHPSSGHAIYGSGGESAAGPSLGERIRVGA